MFMAFSSFGLFSAFLELRYFTFTPSMYYHMTLCWLLAPGFFFHQLSFTERAAPGIHFYFQRYYHCIGVGMD